VIGVEWQDNDDASGNRYAEVKRVGWRDSDPANGNRYDLANRLLIGINM
jgi:hypothetical protein